MKPIGGGIVGHGESQINKVAHHDDCASAVAGTIYSIAQLDQLRN